jgi:hypothetical protein
MTPPASARRLTVSEGTLVMLRPGYHNLRPLYNALGLRGGLFGRQQLFPTAHPLPRLRCTYTMSRIERRTSHPPADRITALIEAAIEKLGKMNRYESAPRPDVGMSSSADEDDQDVVICSRHPLPDRPRHDAHRAGTPVSSFWPCP